MWQAGMLGGSLNTLQQASALQGQIVAGHFVPPEIPTQSLHSLRPLYLNSGEE